MEQFVLLVIVAVAAASDPLFLTPLIKSNQTEQARLQAQINPIYLKNVEAYSGFITVNEKYGSNVFFLYFPPDHTARKTEFIVKLAGGLGTSTLFTSFMENGPVYIEDLKAGLKRRRYSWHTDTHVLFVDSPVGAGYSFTMDPNGYNRNRTHIGEEVLEVLDQFLKMFPEVRNENMYVSGSGYAGKYVPEIALQIHRRNQIVPEEEKLKLDGIMIGNGLLDPINQMVFGDLLYQLGLIDDHQLDHFHSEEAKGLELIKNEQWLKAFDLYNDLILSPNSYFKNATGFNHTYNLMHGNPNDSEVWVDYIESPKVRNAFHVGTKPFVRKDPKVTEHLAEDLLQSVAPLLTELLSHYRVLLYWGQFDLTVQYRASVNFLKKLDFPGSEDYRSRVGRCKWMVLNYFGGYATVAGNLTEVLVRNAGHMVGQDQTQGHMDILHKFINNKQFCWAPEKYN